jgi:hypothetical protein
MPTLRIKNFAHISEASVDFGDLTVLVGPQGAGKSLALQWLKAAIDGKQIVDALRDAGQEVDDPAVLIDLIFGVGMGRSWRKESEVLFDSESIHPESIANRGNGTERAFFIPAHRAMLISDGWAAPFQKLTAETPVVARLFSQNLFDRFSRRGGDRLFPQDRVLKKVYREMIDDAVFHGGTVSVEKDTQHTKRLRLTHGKSTLPFMTWTAGQREFAPLLLGLYTLLPERRQTKVASVDWVVIEEPEMGLHPRAIRVFMLLALELLLRGYRVVVSTHSPMVLTIVWALRQLRENRGGWHSVCDAFDIQTSGHRQALKKVCAESLKKDLTTVLFHFGAEGRVLTKDISQLDPGHPDSDISGWGGLTGLESSFSEAVRDTANGPFS